MSTPNPTTRHMHHIVPRHMGGSDDESNLISLTVEEHAEAHYLLWCLHGRWEDKLAWLGLSGRIGKDEIIRIKQLEGASKGGKITGKINGLLPASDKAKEVASKIGKITGKINGLLPASDKQKESVRQRNFKNNPMHHPIIKAKANLKKSKHPKSITKWTKELARLQALES